MKIKPLVWKGYGDNLDAAAYGVTVAYRIVGEPGDWTLRSLGDREYVDTPGYNTQIDAKNAAWVTHTRRLALMVDGLEVAR